MKKYPLLLSPVTKDYLWGGDRLKTEYGIPCPTDICAEGWMLACHADGTNTVLNGELKGKSFKEALSLWGKKDEFPILIKLIDAKDKLSVQVHPEDEYAYKNEGEPGKTEMWYIVDCDEGAELIYGFKRSVDKAEFERRIKDNTLDEVVNYVPVKKGDVFFIAAGTLHAIGKGILIAEIQQNSNTTYRVSDYGRLGADGKPRALHLTKAMEVADLSTPTLPYGDVGERVSTPYGVRRHLADCAYFSADSVELSGKMELSAEDFISVLVLEGAACATWETKTLSLQKGDSLFLPKGVTLTLTGTASLILSAPENIF